MLDFVDVYVFKLFKLLFDMEKEIIELLLY